MSFAGSAESLTKELETSDSTKATTTISRLDTFAPFPRLPVEIKRMIINFALPPRLVAIGCTYTLRRIPNSPGIVRREYCEFDACERAKFSHIPALFKSFSLARSVAKQQYAFCFAANLFSKKNIHFSPAKDTLLFENIYTLVTFYVKGNVKVENVNSIALPQAMAIAAPSERLVKLLARVAETFTQLKEFVLIVPDFMGTDKPRRLQIVAEVEKKMGHLALGKSLDIVFETSMEWLARKKG